MTPFAYAAAADAHRAVARVAEVRGAEFIAGGTDGLPLASIEVGPNRTRIGALCRMADVADDPRIQAEFPVVAQALLASASPQVRNMASIGGNLLQRTRCLYFRDVATPCNKREPGSGCPAQDGQNRLNTILGGSPHCIAAYPGDLAVALVALDADVEVIGARGERVIPVADLHRLPGSTPHIETVLEPGDLIAAVVIPASAHARRSYYVKVRDRASFEFALASAAVALDIDGGTIRQARVAVGGVATKPWRLAQVEQALIGQRMSAEVVRAAAERAAAGAAPRQQNAFKVELMQRTVERALQAVGGQR